MNEKWKRLLKAMCMLLLERFHVGNSESLSIGVLHRNPDRAVEFSGVRFQVWWDSIEM